MAPKQAHEQSADLMAAFDRAKSKEAAEPPDLLAAFSRAARERDERGSEDGSGSALDRARPADPPGRDGPGNGRER